MTAPSPSPTQPAPAGSLTGDELAAVDLISRGLARTAERMAALQAERAELVNEIRRLWMMPLRTDEARAVVLKYVDDFMARMDFPRAAGWSAVFETFARPKGSRPVHNGEGFEPGSSVRGDLLCLADLTSRAENGLPTGASPFTSGLRGLIGDVSDARQLEELLWFALGDTLRARIAERIEDLFPVVPNEATRRLPSIAQRRERIAAAEARRAEIDTQLEDLRVARERMTIGADILAQAPGR